MVDPFAASAQYFGTPLQQTVFFEHYSRFSYELGRRETWVETVGRAVAYLRELSRNLLSPEDYDFLRTSILNLRALPSMRLLAMAGPAARRQNVSIYNCSYLPLDALEAFGEIMLLCMSGAGVGYSVERQYVEQLPPVSYQRGMKGYHLVEDTTEGWVEALMTGLQAWFSGVDIEFNYLLVRPAGSVLRVKGGRASGPGPLKESLDAIRGIILGRQGRRLRPIDAHNIACWIASASISGGTRRSALISLFDDDDQEMLDAKRGAFWTTYPQRMFANNSAVISDSTSDAHLERLLRTMDENGTGEPGLFNRSGSRGLIPPRRLDAEFGLNPCGEVLLRPMQVCNLTSAICRAEDNIADLADKVRAATLIGTIQSMADYFPGFRPEWRQNQVEERLLGVDLNGQMDCPEVQRRDVQDFLRKQAVALNWFYAGKLGINRAAAITTVKPSGNSSQLTNASSGLHVRWAPYYIRHVRLTAHSPVLRVLRECGVPAVPENGYTEETTNIWVVPFPVASPEGAICRNDRDALEQLEYWRQVRLNYTEHQPSVTITYRPGELEDIVAWSKANRDVLTGVSFLPANDHAYPLAPYQEVPREEYERLAAAFPPIDFSRIAAFEQGDHTTATHEVACTAGGCELP